MAAPQGVVTGVMPGRETALHLTGDRFAGQHERHAFGGGRRGRAKIRYRPRTNQPAMLPLQLGQVIDRVTGVGERFHGTCSLPSLQVHLTKMRAAGSPHTVMTCAKPFRVGLGPGAHCGPTPTPAGRSAPGGLPLAGVSAAKAHQSRPASGPAHGTGDCVAVSAFTASSPPKTAGSPTPCNACDRRGVKMTEPSRMRPCFAQRVTVLLSTLNIWATWWGVRRFS